MGFLTKKKNYAADLRYLSGRDGVEHLVAVIDRVGKKRRVVYAALTSVAPPHVIRSLLGIGREEYEKLKDEAVLVEKEASIPGFKRVGVFLGKEAEIEQCETNWHAICDVVHIQDVFEYQTIEEDEYQRRAAHALDVEASEKRGAEGLAQQTAQQTWDIKADAAAREARGAVQLGALETALKGARSEFRQSKAEVAESNAWARQNNALIQESAQKLAQAVAQKEEDLEEVKEQLSSLLKEVEEVKEVKSSLKEMVALLREKNPARITRGDSYAPDSPAFTTPPRPRSDELPPDFDRDFNKCNIGGWDAVPTPSPTTAKKALLSERGAFLPRGDANVAVDSPAAIDAFDAPSPKALPPPPEEMKSPEEDVPPRVRGPGLSGHLAARFSDPRLSYAEKCGHLAAKRATRTDENGEFLPWPQPAPKSSADPVVLRVGSLPKPTEAQLAAGEAQANAK